MANRFFVNAPFDGILRGENAHHAARVLRLRKSERVIVCDGCSREAIAVITNIDAESVHLDVEKWHDCRTEPLVNLTIFIAVAKGDRMNYAIQKSVELGAKVIVPFVSNRCVAKAEGNKPERWRKIVKQAAMQAGRGIIPDMCIPVTFEQAVAIASESELSLFCYEVPIGISLKKALPESPPNNIAVMCGPEGGFTENEAMLAMQSMQAVKLGSRILRCETAPVVALAAITTHYDL